jgi:hypothetical protein
MHSLDVVYIAERDIGTMSLSIAHSFGKGRMDVEIKIEIKFD